MAGYAYGRVRMAGRGRSFRGFFRRRPRLRVLPEVEPPSAEEVDRILEKIRAGGIASLTRGERALLDRASRR
jgi:hypothetical protein